jgi:ankyrin repeat protein
VCQAPFTWIPQPVPPVKKKNLQITKSLLSGFGMSSLVVKVLDNNQTTEEKYEAFPHDSIMKQYNKTSAGKSARDRLMAQDCLVKMIAKQINMVSDGKRVRCRSVSDVGNSRLLCALLNSFVPLALPTELLPKDRWTINTVLRMMEMMFFLPQSEFDSEDLVEADEMSVCAYFCVLLMMAFKYRQCHMVNGRVQRLRRLQRDKMANLSELIAAPNTQDSLEVQQIQSELAVVDSELKELASKFDVEHCLKWTKHVEMCAKQLHSQIREKMETVFDIVTVPCDVIAKDLCQSTSVNLVLTGCLGFSLVEYKETVSVGRKVIVRDVQTGKFIWQKAASVHKLLGISRTPKELNPNDFTQYEIFVEIQSPNKLLKTGSQYLYQVFPADKSIWNKSLLSAVSEDDLEAVNRMTLFLANDTNFLNATDPKTGNSALHVASSLGYHQIVECLLERGADIDQKNLENETALFSACIAGHYHVAHLLIEWGCDVSVMSEGPARNAKTGKTAFELTSTPALRNLLVDIYEHYSTCVPPIADGDIDLLEKLFNDHVTGANPLSCIRSRCISGTTLLHAAVYFGRVKLARRILSEPSVDLEMVDYRGASVLHRARGGDTVRYLLEEGVDVNAVDHEGNTALHVKCYGEPGEKSDVDAIKQLVEAGARMDSTNNRLLTALHCAAMQGRIDVMELLLSADTDEVLAKSLQLNTNVTPPSLMFLSVVNDYINSAVWLANHHFTFKAGEANHLLLKLIIEELHVHDRLEAVRLLLNQGADAGYVADEEQDGSTLLHLAARRPTTEQSLIETLVDYGAELEATDCNGETALFAACRSNCMSASIVLLARGASMTVQNFDGLTPFDCISDLDEWISSGLFLESTVALMRVSSMRQGRELVRNIMRKVRPKQHLERRRSGPEAELMRRLETLCVTDSVSGTFNNSMWSRVSKSKAHLVSTVNSSQGPTTSRHRSFIPHGLNTASVCRPAVITS